MTQSPTRHEQGLLRRLRGHPRLLAAKAAGTLCGSFVGSEAEAREAVALGARLVVASSDTHWLLQSTRNACTAFVSIVGGP